MEGCGTGTPGNSDCVYFDICLNFEWGCLDKSLVSSIPGVFSERLMEVGPFNPVTESGPTRLFHGIWPIESSLSVTKESRPPTVRLWSHGRADPGEGPTFVYRWKSDIGVFRLSPNLPKKLRESVTMIRVRTPQTGILD